MESNFADLSEMLTEIIEQKIDEVATECETYEEVRNKLIKDTNFFSGSIGYKLIEKHIIRRALLQKIER